ncbi:hypothetical protein [Allorhodopirellula heiligendammensis]|uniref:Glycosyl-4,4'-diaponeurosporenoate acyltransferase n=1 Tax=Allorhodopirellula heiligendammensis TaxID=2714739 RepID=A0A5C6BWD3_9BACT|nr:hypothetical protein [Allorhodopirellula heiligendammensis]TWU16560.1 hypothetical protein Poly21_37650 [Allorhodopirellula heiligendammensis]
MTPADTAVVWQGGQATIDRLAQHRAGNPLLRAGRVLGVRLRRRLPRCLRRRNQPDCLAEQIRRLRIWLVILAILPVAVWGLRFSLMPVSRNDFMASLSNRLLAISLLCFALGACVGLMAIPIYRAAHRRRLRNSLRYHHRGVSLRSFISKWDDPTQAIYRSCRLSARLARVHDQHFLIMSSCFAAAGCLAAVVQTDLLLGELLCMLTVLAIAGKWPTTGRLVRWCGRVIDPLYQRRDEYTEY